MSHMPYEVFSRNDKTLTALWGPSTAVPTRANTSKALLFNSDKSGSFSIEIGFQSTSVYYAIFRKKTPNTLNNVELQHLLHICAANGQWCHARFSSPTEKPTSVGKAEALLTDFRLHPSPSIHGLDGTLFASLDEKRTVLIVFRPTWMADILHEMGTS